MDDAPHPAPSADLSTRRRGPRLVPVVAAVCAVLVTAGCGGGGKADAKAETGRHTARPSARASPGAKPARVDQLASAAGCKPDFTTRVDDYRQAVCKTGKGKFLFLDFVSDKGQRDWLDTAQMYGGVYLVGDRWVLSSSPRKNMDTLRREFGGTIEEGTSYGASPSSR
ncbi:hypothetical protein ABZS71_04600 [Streptomyces sp. NPDC005393]|uniref:hypothetical protein n=1 Tax=Streptomyces sp. NPDC005393 TaxID=3157041 RepID=UPI0033BAE22E